MHRATLQNIVIWNMADYGPRRRNFRSHYPKHSNSSGWLYHRIRLWLEALPRWFMCVIIVLTLYWLLIWGCPGTVPPLLTTGYIRLVSDFQHSTPIKCELSSAARCDHEG